MAYKRNFRGDFHRARREHPSWPSVVSEGDSWFSYELRGNVIDRLDDPLDTAPDNQQHWALLRLEKSGDEISQILSGGQRAYLREKVLGAFDDIDALLFSAGGNDIIGPDLLPLLKEYDDGDDVALEDRFHQDKVDDRLGEIERLYGELITLCAETQPDLHIYAHGYDYPVNLGEPARVVDFPVAGPWILEHFKTRGYGGQPDLQREMLRYLVDRLNDMLAGVDAAHERFHHVDVRGVVGDAWTDEIHPNRIGAKQVARKFHKQLKQQLNGLIPPRP